MSDPQKPPIATGPLPKSSDPALIIHISLTHPGFQLLMNQPPVWKCPLMDSLNGELKLLYLYADGTPVPYASFTVEVVTDNPVAAGPLETNGRQVLKLPKGLSYQFYFHKDKAALPKDNPSFDFFGAYSIEVPELNPAIAVWNPTLATHGKDEQRRLSWGNSLSAGTPENPAKPSVERFLLYIVEQAVPLPGQPKLQQETALILLAMLLGAHQDESLWHRLVLNRAGVSAGRRSRLVQELGVCLFGGGEDDIARLLTSFLNSAGKGNAADFFRQFSKELGAVEKTITKHIEALLDALRTQLIRLRDTATAGQSNQEIATRLLLRLNDFPLPAQRVHAVIAPMAGKIGKAFAPSPPFRIRTKAEFGQENVYRQVQFPFPKYIPGPVTLPLTWFEAQFLYANAKPVSKAKMLVKEANSQTTGAIQTAGEDGIGFVETPVGKPYEFRFHDDPNEYQLFKTRKLKANDIVNAGVGMVEAAIQDGKFRSGTPALCWGDALFTENGSFKIAPSLSQIANAIARNLTAHVPSADDHKELSAFLYPFIMGDLLPESERKDVWKQLAFQRLGGCLGEWGVVIRDLLYQLDATADPKVERVLECLNSAGQGNAYQYLVKLHSEMDAHVKSVADNLTEILDALNVELGKLSTADESDVVPAQKRYCNDVADRIAKRKLEVEVKIRESLAVARERLDAVRQQEEPKYTGTAVAMSLTVVQLKETTLDPRPAAVPPAIDWIELEYLHTDDLFVADAEYVVTDEAGTTVLYEGKLVSGYAHLAVSKGLKCKYHFRRDKAFVLDPSYATVSLSVTPLPDTFLETAIATDKLKAAPGFFSWDDCTISDQSTFGNTPTCGKIAHQCVLMHTKNVAWKDDEMVLAKLMAPLIQQTGDMPALWTGAVFQGLGAVDVPEARVIQELLHYLQANSLTATATELLKRINSAGKGNGFRFLEKLRDDMPSHTLAVAKRLKDILLEFKTQCGKIENGLVEKFGPGMQGYAKLLAGKVDTLDVDKGVKDLLDPLTLTLTDKLATHTVNKLAWNLGALNQVKQESVPLVRFDVPAAALTPWIGIQYLHADLTPVAAKCLLSDNTDATVSDPTLAIDGTMFAHALSLVKTYKFHFHKEPAFTIHPGTQSQATTLAALAPDLTLIQQKFFSAFRDTATATMPIHRYAWGPTGIKDMDEFESDPHLGKICRYVVRKRTPFLTKATDPKDEIEMSEMLRYLILENQEANLRVWSIVAMNRIGAEDANGLLRRAVLLRLVFQDPFPGDQARELVAMLNSAGKGHAAEWLQAMAAGLDAIRDAAILNAETILQEVRDEVVKLNRTPLSAYVKNRAVALGVRALTVKGEANAKIKAIIDPLTVKLKALFGLAAPKFLLSTNGALNQLNVFVQPVLPVPECSPDCEVAPAWPHDQNTEVQYLYPDGSAIVGAVYRMETAAAPSLFTGPTIANGKSGNKTIPAGTSVVKYYFQDDPLEYTLKAAIKPWANPFRSLPNNYATVAAATNILFACTAIPAGTLTVQGQPAFNLAPSIGRMISDAVIKKTPNVSAADDVQDLGAVIQNLIADPPVSTDDIWFRAGVNGLGSIADDGSVLRGLYLFFKYKAPVDAATLLALMNWAGKGNVAKWLKLVNWDIQIQASSTRLQAVLVELHARLEDLRGHLQVHANIKIQIAGIQGRVDAARLAAPAKIKAQLEPQKVALLALLQTSKLWIKFSAGPMTLNTYQQQIEEFLECNDQLALTCKNKTDELAGDRVVAGNTAFVYTLLPPTPAPGPPQSELFDPGKMDNHGWMALSEYQAGTRGGEGKRLAPILSKSSKANFPSDIEGVVRTTTLQAVRNAPPTIVSGAWTVTLGSWSGGEMWSFQHTDGTLIRYKPDGDDFMHPPCATYSIELIKDTLQGYVNATTNPLNGTAFKIDGQGNAVPKGPGDKTALIACPLCGGTAHLVDVNKHYTAHLMKSGHRPLRF